jgi:hypothetical protein
LLIFGEALRRELRGSGVRVCQVLPTGVNTAGFLHTRTRGFRFPRQITWLLQDPETVARAVVRCLERRWVRNIPLGLQGKATLAAGHGLEMTGDDVAQKLRGFTERFTPPRRGRYVGSPPVASEGDVEELPSLVPDPYARGAVGALAAGSILFALARLRKR